MASEESQREMVSEESQRGAEEVFVAVHAGEEAHLVILGDLQSGGG